MAKLVTRKEVEYDGTEDHVGLFTGSLAASKRPKRAEPSRPNIRAIAAARRAAGTKTGAASFAKLLALHRKDRGATKRQLAELAGWIGTVPPDLAQLLAWSNGNTELGLMSIAEMIEVYGAREAPETLPLNANENGDYWCLILTGPLRGALISDDYELDDPPAEAIDAISLRAWLADRDA